MNKKRITVSLLMGVLACCVLSLSAQVEGSGANIKIQGLTAALFSPTGVVYDGGGMNNAVKLITPSYSVAGARSVEFGTVTARCFGVESGTTLVNAALFANANSPGTYQDTNYPYIQIEPSGGTVITDIAFECLNANPANSNVPMGFGVSSNGGSPFTPIYSFSPLPGIIPDIDDNLYIGANGSVSEFAKSSQVTGEYKLPIPSDKQTIRLAAHKTFPRGGQIATNISPWYVVGIYVWTKGTDTSIEADLQNPAFGFTQSNEALTFSEPVSQVSVYDVSGQLMQAVKNVECLPLNGLPPGVYVIKAIGETGKTLVSKIVK